MPELDLCLKVVGQSGTRHALTLEELGLALKAAGFSRVSTVPAFRCLVGTRAVCFEVVIAQV
jgi:hypothetical protein